MIVGIKVHLWHATHTHHAKGRVDRRARAHLPPTVGVHDHLIVQLGVVRVDVEHVVEVLRAVRAVAALTCTAPLHIITQVARRGASGHAVLFAASLVGFMGAVPAMCATIRRPGAIDLIECRAEDVPTAATAIEETTVARADQGGGYKLAIWDAITIGRAVEDMHQDACLCEVRGGAALPVPLIEAVHNQAEASARVQG